MFYNLYKLITKFYNNDVIKLTDSIPPPLHFYPFWVLAFRGSYVYVNMVFYIWLKENLFRWFLKIENVMLESKTTKFRLTLPYVHSAGEVKSPQAYIFYRKNKLEITTFEKKS